MAMFFVQHGIAVDKSIDPQRPLSTEGARSVRVVAHQLAGSKPDIIRIFHSGKLRAEQTAAIFAEVLHLPQPLPHNDLNPNDDIELLKTQLADASMYVGHLPHLEKLVGDLLCTGSQRILSFENAAVAWVEQDQQGYCLEGLIKPSQLRDGVKANA